MGKYRAYPEYKNSGVEWLEEIPKHWGAKKLKFISSVQPSNIDKKSKEDEVPVELCNYTDVYYNEEIDSSLTFMKASATNEQIKKFTLRAGDTIITKDSEDPRDIAIPAYVPKTLTGVVCGYHLAMIRPKDSDMGSYIKRVFETGYARSYFSTRANGLTRYGLGTYPLGNIYFPIPPKDEARNIAAFLDHETAKIDRLIARQERLIELLKEKRQAAISHAVTKGLNPDAPMKDSGVEWLGEVPAHWKMIKFSVAASIRNGQVDPRIEPYTDYTLIAPNHIESGTGKLLYVETAAEQGADSGKYLCKAGEVIYSKIRPALTKACLSPSNTVLCSADMYPVQARGELTNEFLLRFMLTKEFTTFATLASDRVAMPKINREALAECRAPVPPADEQKRIIQFIETSINTIDTLVEKVGEAIALMKEHRTALISAAVTGKIDVRGWQQPSIEPQAAATAASA